MNNIPDSYDSCCTDFTNYGRFKEYFANNRTTQLWVDLLQIQCEVYVREDLQFFYNSLAFQNAKSVLDFGCGPGDLLRTLNRYFPGKTYTGIDISADYIHLAAKRFKKNANMRFVCDNIYTYKGAKFDYILSRQVVQHLPDNIAMLKCMKPLLNKNGHILAIDTVDALKKFSSPMPVMKKMYRDLAAQLLKHGGNRGAIDIIENRCPEAGFNVSVSMLSPVFAYTDPEKRLMLKMFMFISEIVKRKFSVVVDQNSFYKELNAWQKNSGSYGQAGTKHLEMRPIIYNK